METAPDEQNKDHTVSMQILPSKHNACQLYNRKFGEISWFTDWHHNIIT